MKLIKLLPILVCFLVVVLMLFMGGKNYSVGGDDMRLYYVFPDKYLQNYAFNIISENTLAGANTGYSSVAYFAPMYAFIWFIKFIPVNTQYLLYGLNLAFGFLFVYLLIGLLTKNKAVVPKTIAASLYVLSPYLINTLYSHQMLAFYLVSVVPATVYFFLKGVIDKKITYTLISVVIFSMFSTTLNTLPWLAASALSLSPIFAYIFLENKKTFFIHGVIFTICLLLLNSYWVFHFANAYFNNTGLSSTLEFYSSGSFVEDNKRIIRGVSTLYSPLNIIFFQMDRFLVDNFTIIKLASLSIIASFLLAGSQIYKSNSRNKLLFAFCTLSFLLTWFLFNPNLSVLGPEIYIKLANKIPFFTMFRNMYDKFGLGMSLVTSLLLGISLINISSEKSKKYIYITLTSLLVVTSVVIMPKFIERFNHKQENLSSFSGIFNSDFLNLVEYIKHDNNQSRILWLPLNSPTYVNIEDANNPGVFYSGLSPIRVLTGKGDYAGRFSFITQSDLFKGDKVFKLLKEKEYVEVGRILQQMNARYIIVDHQELPNQIANYMYDESRQISDWQNNDFKKVILGKKVQDFGNRYSLYEINENFMSDRFYLTNNTNKIPTTSTLTYSKISSSEYQVHVKNISKDSSLVFLDPFYKDWEIFNQKGEKLNMNQSVIWDYANSWEVKDNIKPDDILTVKFRPAQSNHRMYWLSGGVAVILVLVIVVNLTKDIMLKKHDKN